MKYANEIKKHMEYLGYETEQQDSDMIQFTKPGYPLILINADESGIRLYGQYRINYYAANNIDQFLRYINDLNLVAQITRFTFYNETNAIGLATHLVGEYTRNSFAKLIGMWEYDITTLIYNNKQTDTFLGESSLDESDNLDSYAAYS